MYFDVWVINLLVGRFQRFPAVFNILDASLYPGFFVFVLDLFE